MLPVKITKSNIFPLQQNCLKVFDRRFAPRIEACDYKKKLSLDIWRNQ